jgi:hypothetical protein
MERKTDLYEHFLKTHKKGVLREYPVDITAIHTFGITMDEMKPYETDPKYSDVHWSVVLEEILKKRETNK